MVVTFLDPGALNARLELEAPLATPDGQGGATLAYQPVTALWARIEPVSLQVGERAGADDVILTHRIWTVFRTGVERGMRLRKGARFFMIRAVQDFDETGRYLVCQCEEAGL